jgi:hypothetical protein
MRIFYALLAIIVVAGVAIVGTTFLGNKQPSPAPQSGSGANPAAPQAGGRTADGFYYKGNSDAKIIVTEYSDYQ